MTDGPAVTANPAALLAAISSLIDQAGIDPTALAATDPRSHPTLAAYIDKLAALLSENTRRTWITHWRRLSDGSGRYCARPHDGCTDPEAGCTCGCKACTTAAVQVPAAGHKVLTPGAFSRSELELAVEVARRAAAARAARDNRRRARCGLAPKPELGKGAAELAITAYRHLFSRAVDDDLIDRNPAERIRKPARDDSVRRSITDPELAELFAVIASGGDDPNLDLLLAWTHLEAMCRREGALGLTGASLRPVDQVIVLVEKGAKPRRQPVSAELIAALAAHAAERGGPTADRNSSAYDPGSPLLYYRAGPDGRPRPLSSRRYDTLHRRVQRALPWAGEIRWSVHALRYTGGVAIERIAGTQVARLALGHGRRTVTDTYIQANEARLAAAVAAWTGAPHPLDPAACTAGGALR